MLKYHIFCIYIFHKYKTYKHCELCVLVVRIFKGPCVSMLVFSLILPN